jgi:hypothetical protein
MLDDATSAISVAIGARLRPLAAGASPDIEVKRTLAVARAKVRNDPQRTLLQLATSSRKWTGGIRMILIKGTLMLLPAMEARSLSR